MRLRNGLHIVGIVFFMICVLSVLGIAFVATDVGAYSPIRVASSPASNLWTESEYSDRSSVALAMQCAESGSCTSPTITPTVPAEPSSTTVPTLTATATASPAAATLTATAAPTCPPSWKPVPAPAAVRWSAISAISSDDIWAVGNSSIPRSMHWNGTEWTSVPVPTTGWQSDSLLGVSANAPDDVWAVGYSYTQSPGVDRTFVVHWRGSHWEIVPSPNVGDSDNRLFDVFALSSGEAWAVGDFINRGRNAAYDTLVLRWDGSVWSRVPSPTLGQYSNFLRSVEGTAIDDVWAVGYYFAGAASNTYRTLVLHWDGQEWLRIPSPNAGAYAFLEGVAAISRDDVWVVGAFNNGWNQTLTIHWNGTTWSVVPSPNVVGLRRFSRVRE